MFASRTLFWCLFSAWVSCISAKQALCFTKTSCRECIQTASCAWCSQPDFRQPRCFLSGKPNFCAEEFTYNPVNAASVIQVFSKAADKSGSTRNENIHISPQKVKLQLRINEVYKMEVKYTQAVDYPVDLYFLMDLSKSMEDDKEKLSALGDLLSDSMRNITSDFRLGFGSFVDKVVMPYVSIIPEKLLEPCDGCAAPYGYKNVMPLSKDTHSFVEQVRNSAVSGNLDEPEGGFDAIMQAVVCRGEIGWREKARRLLVFSTDAGFHYAGDGKLGGIVKPNDGRCHLDKEGMYTHSSLQDYPSISQVNFKVKENSINVIFAVTAQQFSVYNSLSQHIEGSSAGTLAADSGNIVDLIKEQYNKISTSVEMKDNFTSSVEVTYHSTCKGSIDQNTSKCDGLKAEDMVTFTASIKVTSCPKDPKEWNQVFQIYPVGINENLIIEMQMLCDCPCEMEDSPNLEKYSQKHCNGFGTFSCGICKCEPLHFGQFCECSAEDLRLHGTATVEKPGTCRESNTSSEDCSGRGSCVCGQCDCEHEHITGKFCECDNLSCKRHKNLLCAGEDHGKCECGECVCREGWRGPSCDCQTTTDTCIPPGGGKVCGGHGECVCGQCVCDREQEGHSGRFSGPFCDICLNCQGRCAEFKDCVQCQMYKTGPLTEEECASNCTFVPIEAQDVEDSKTNNENLCRYNEDDCHFAYVYYYENDKVIIRAQKEMECQKLASMQWTVIAVMLSIIIIGLITLLLWKLITTVYDRREYARFENERSMAKWDTAENPLYRQATTTFKNPTYGGR